jgi:cell wall-associated NlpC family hydrolase
MRLSWLLLALVPLLAFPAVGSAAPAPLRAPQLEAKQLSPEAEHALLSSAQAAPPPTGPASGGSRPKVVAEALRHLGTPYRYGGGSPSGFDCSGFIMYVYAKVGVELPHNAAMQYGGGRSVKRAALVPGDLVFFNGLSHAGIYIGRGRFVHSPQTGDVVKVSRLGEGWYRATYVGARRY